MKRLFLIFVMVGVLFTAGNAVQLQQANAADVIVSITVEEEYVDGLTEMVTERWLNTPDCSGLNVKQCYAKKGLAEPATKDFLRYKRAKRRKATRDANRAARAADEAASDADEFEVLSQ